MTLNIYVYKRLQEKNERDDYICTCVSQGEQPPALFDRHQLIGLLDDSYVSVDDIVSLCDRSSGRRSSDFMYELSQLVQNYSSSAPE